MRPSIHAIFGFIFSLLVLLIFPSVGLLGLFTIWLSSVLIDFDHYLYFVLRNKNLSLKKSYNWYFDLEKKYYSLPKEKRRNLYFGFYFLHGIEAIIVLILLFYIFKFDFFLYVALGFIFHQFSDLIELRKRNIKSYKIMSFFYSLYKARNKTSLDKV